MLAQMNPIRHFQQLNAAGWTSRVVLLLWGLLLVGAVASRYSRRQTVETPDFSKLSSFTVSNLATGEKIDLVDGGKSTAAAFIDPRCDVCTTKSERVMRAGDVMGNGPAAIVVLTPLPELARVMGNFGYPIERLFVVDSAVLRQLQMRYVPIFVNFGEGRPDVVFRGLPSRARIWLHTLRQHT